MKNIVILFLVPTIILIFGCDNRLTPFSGIYELNNSRISAVVIDSRFCIMVGVDTAYFYSLHSIEEIFLPELMSEEDRIYVFGVVFSNSLSRKGVGNFEAEFDFSTNENYGNTVLAIFKRNTIMVGGLEFRKPSNNERSKEIFNNYTNLITFNKYSN